MKINTSKKEVCFDTLKLGDVFCFGHDYFLKTEELDDVNAVSLLDGTFGYFADGDCVYEYPDAHLEVS